MVRGFSFRLLYRVVFLCFCLIFACFYHHGGGSGYDRREESNKLKGKSLNRDVFLKQDERVPNLTENAKQVDGDEARKKADLSKMVRKETVMKTPQSDRIRKSPELPFSTPSPPEVKVPSKESTTISHSSDTKSKNNGGENISSLKNKIFYQNGLRGMVEREYFASLTTQHLRRRRDAISENKVSSTECANSTFTIKYEDEYRVWNNFSMMYQGRIYHYDEYRVTDDGLQVCNTSEPLTQQRWRNFTSREKRTTAFKHCNVSVDGFYHHNYRLFKNFTVFFQPTEQSFTRQDYGVIFGFFAICSAKLSLSCNDDLVKAKYDEQYNVFKNFSLFYNDKMYDYREYRFNHDSLEMCASNDSRVQVIWRTRNAWEKFKDVYKCRGRSYDLSFYVVKKQFTVYNEFNGQHLTRNDYAVRDGKPCVCEEKLRYMSTEYTQGDLLMCNDSIINIKYDDEYKVWNNFSILHKNKVYDYTEYRVLNDGIKICNSTDNNVRNIWKLRNFVVKAVMDFKSCNKPSNLTGINREYYTANKQFTVYVASSSRFLTRNDYAVIGGELITCEEKLRPDSIEYTKEDLLMCNDSIINIKYDDEYKVWNSFSILYKNKVYDYTEYRVLSDGIKICNSTDNNVRNIWKQRNYWVKETMHFKSCNKPITYIEFYPGEYTVLKDFRVVILGTKQVITRYDYGVFQSGFMICYEKLNRKNSNIIGTIIQLCAVVLSDICLLLLLIVYGMLPELRTLPGLNLMSLSFAFLLWQTYVVVTGSLSMRKVEMNNTLCAWEKITSLFTLCNILTNSAVNVYHLRKTFCGNTLAKSDEKRWKTFLKYSFFGWGVTVIIMVVQIVLVKVDILRFYPNITGDCVNDNTIPYVAYNGVSILLLLYIIVAFSFTAYRLRQKLKASRSVAQSSNIVKNRNSFILYLKLFSITALTFWLPLIIRSFVDTNNVHIRSALFTASNLTGFYIGIAFVFTRKNYQLLKKKYFPAKNKPANEIVAA